MPGDEQKKRLYVLGYLLDHGASAGRAVREAFVEEAGQQWNGPSFYQLMACLEDEKLVEGWYEDHIVDDVVLRRRCFRLTDGGSTWLERKRTELSAGPEGASFAIC